MALRIHALEEDNLRSRGVVGSARPGLRVEERGEHRVAAQLAQEEDPPSRLARGLENVGAAWRTSWRAAGPLRLPPCTPKPTANPTSAIAATAATAVRRVLLPRRPPPGIFTRRSSSAPSIRAVIATAALLASDVWTQSQPRSI
jgi:hypothetical protein